MAMTVVVIVGVVVGVLVLRVGVVPVVAELSGVAAVTVAARQR